MVVSRILSHARCLLSGTFSSLHRAFTGTSSTDQLFRTLNAAREAINGGGPHK